MSLSTSDFNPRSPHGERRGGTLRVAQRSEFQPTLPARGATSPSEQPNARYGFQPTLPARGATGGRSCSGVTAFISTHAPRTGSDIVARYIQRARRISTHAPRTGSDGINTWQSSQPAHFNPRSPHGERLAHQLDRRAVRLFQPTLPARGATHHRRPRVHAPAHFNPRSPHGERLAILLSADFLYSFQPTLPARGATPASWSCISTSRFQPTLPARGATGLCVIQLGRG